MFACVLALLVLVRGFRRHRWSRPLLLATPGLALLLLGVTYAESYSIVLHSALVTCGGLLVAAAHIIKMRRDHQLDGHRPGPQCAH
jgi:hypothetical protein